MLHARLKVITKESVIQKRILRAIKDHLNKKIPKIEESISNKAQSLILESLNASNETRSIISGKLRGELGITDPTGSLSQIFNGISKMVDVKVSRARKAGQGIRMSITLYAVPIDLSAFNHIGSYITEKGQIIPWFEWLTTLGDRVIVRKYDAEVGHPEFSRTGNTIMVTGSGWRVPPEFSGTATNNFVTRATDAILPELAQQIEKSFGDML